LVDNVFYNLVNSQGPKN